MNKVSSRSHAVFTITIDQTNVIHGGEGSTAAKKRSKIHLIDLAGSERANQTGAIGNRLKEGSSINLSLSCLGNVINALCTKNNHIPYRDSKLTYLLSDSLGGNSLTLVLACLNPTESCYESSIGTLKFAERAKKVQNQARVNIDPKSLQILALRKEIEMLKLALLNCRCDHTKETNIRKRFMFLNGFKEKMWYQKLFCKTTEDEVMIPSGIEIEKSTVTLVSNSVKDDGNRFDITLPTQPYTSGVFPAIKVKSNLIRESPDSARLNSSPSARSKISGKVMDSFNTLY
jgi:hypothetical protein